MTNERIKEIQDKTAHPDSKTVYLALMQVWNECEREKNINIKDATPNNECLSMIEESSKQQ